MKNNNKKSKSGEIIFGIFTIIKNSFLGLASALWLLVIYWIAQKLFGTEIGLINFQSMTNLAIYVYLPLIVIINSVLEIREYKKGGVQ